jgi:hypothetical protein
VSLNSLWKEVSEKSRFSECSLEVTERECFGQARAFSAWPRGVEKWQHSLAPAAER